MIGAWDLDEELIAAARVSGEPGLAVYPHPGVAVVIGRGGDPEIETNVAAIAADGVPLLRRRGGGCAVVLDPGNLVISAVLPLPGIGRITSTFAAVSREIAASLAAAGIPGVAQAGVSDLALGDRKLGGACIWRTRGLIYYSTTLLVDPDWALIDRYLPPPPREPAYRQRRPHRAFLTSLADRGLAPPVSVLATHLRHDLIRRLVELEIQLNI